MLSVRRALLSASIIPVMLKGYVIAFYNHFIELLLAHSHPCRDGHSTSISISI